MQAVACCLSLWEQYAPKLRPQGIKPFLGIKIASSGSDIQSNFIDQISQSNQPFLKRELLYTEWWLLLHHVKFEPPFNMFRYLNQDAVQRPQSIKIVELGLEQKTSEKRFTG